MTGPFVRPPWPTEEDYDAMEDLNPRTAATEPIGEHELFAEMYGQSTGFPIDGKVPSKPPEDPHIIAWGDGDADDRTEPL